MIEDLKMPNNLYEFRKFVFKYIIEDGYGFIARDKDGGFYAYSNKPTKLKRVWIFDDGDKLKDISLVSCIFTDIKWTDKEPFRIPYTNWKEVTVDTPVVYTSDITVKDYVRYFCKYNEENDRVVLYTDGRTSLTEQGTFEAYPERVSIYKQGEN